jgi:hypothetical protein
VPDDNVIYFTEDEASAFRDGQRRFVPSPPTGDHEAGTTLGLGTPMFERPSLTVTLDSVRVFRTGFELTIAWTLEAGDGPFDELYAVLSSLRRILRIERPSPQIPTFTMNYGSAPVTPSTNDSFHYSDDRPATETQSLTFEGGSWVPHSDTEHRFTTRMWSWPLPPARSVALVAEWEAIAMDTTPVRIDGGTIVETA